MNNMHEGACGCAQAHDSVIESSCSISHSPGAYPCTRRVTLASGVDFAFFLHSSIVFFLQLVLGTWEKISPTYNVSKAF